MRSKLVGYEMLLKSNIKWKVIFAEKYNLILRG